MENLTPITRKETFLAKAAGQDVETPTPVTREEVFLDAIAKGGGGGSGSLPSVTSSDNGKVLGVDDGAWAAQGDITVSASMYNSYFVELTGETPTLAELQALYKSGRKLILDFGLNMKVALDASAEAVTYTVFMGESVRLTFPDMEYDGTSKVMAMFYDDDGVLGYHIYIIPNNKFIVTLTPTSPDYSGTMDKTVAEINAAYEAGQEIVFRLYDSPVAHYDIALAFARQDSDSNRYYVFYILDTGNNIIINAWTTSNPLGNGYYTKVYSITPAS